MLKAYRRCHTVIEWKMHLLSSLKGPLQKLWSPNLLGIPQSWSIRELKQQRYSGYQRFFLACDEELSPGACGLHVFGRRPEKRTAAKTSPKKWIRAVSNFIALIPTLLIYQMLAFFQELNSKGLYLSSQKKKKTSGCLVFTSSTEREIRKFHV